MKFLKKLARVALASVAFTIATAPIVYADTPQAPITVSNQTITFSHTSWTLLIQMVLPVIIGLVLKSTASKQVKAVVAALASLIAAIIAQRVLLPNGTSVVTVAAAWDAFVIWLGSQVWYNRLYSEFDLNDKLLPSKGLG